MIQLATKKNANRILDFGFLILKEAEKKRPERQEREKPVARMLN